MSKPIYRVDELPDPSKEPEFWAFLEDPNLPRVANLLIINEIRKYAPETLNDAQCRTQLAKLKAYQELIDFPIAVKNKDTGDTVSDIPPEFQ